MEFSNNEPFAKSSPLPLLSNQEPLWTVTGNKLLCCHEIGVWIFIRQFSKSLWQNVKFRELSEHQREDESRASWNFGFHQRAIPQNWRERGSTAEEARPHRLRVTSACKYPASLSVVDEMSKFTPVLTLVFTLKPRASPAPVIHQLKTADPLFLSRNRSSQFSQFPGGGIGKNE